MKSEATARRASPLARARPAPAGAAKGLAPDDFETLATWTDTPVTRHDRYLQRLAEQVAARGYAVPHIAPDPDSGQPPYAYTAGLHVTHGYELAFSGLPGIASDMLGLLAEALAERGTTPADGLGVDGLLHGGYSIRLRPVGDTARFPVIGALFPDLPARPAIWQALWPDPGHRFPGDADCQTTTSAQALL